MKSENVVRNSGSTDHNGAPSKQRRSRETVECIAPDVNTLLTTARITQADLAQKLKVSNHHLSVARSKVQSLKQANAYLRDKLIKASAAAAMANFLACHDTLTGLPNRRLLLDRIHQAIAQAARQEKRVALIFFDVDGFKTINDKLGHANGDTLLQMIAQRLCGCLRAADTACRYGGDEFIVLLPEIDGEQSATIVEQKIRTRLAAPYHLDSATIAVTLSMGTAVYPDAARDHHELIRLADAAMYRSKVHNGPDPLTNGHMNSTMQSRLD